MTARTIVLGPGRTKYVCGSCYRGAHECEQLAGRVRCDCGCAITPWPFDHAVDGTEVAV